MKLIYDVEDRPRFGQVVVFAIQQMLAIMAATLVVPVLVNANGVENLNMDIAAALAGAGFGTFVYLLFTKFKSPVFLGSSFAFLGSMFSATVSAVANETSLFDIDSNASYTAISSPTFMIVSPFASLLTLPRQ